MPATLGNDLANLGDRYYVNFNGLTRTWRILDLQHSEVLKFRDLEEDIPDDSPAITILSEGMFTKLISEAMRLGMLDSILLGTPGITSNAKEVSELKDKQIEDLNDKIKSYEEDIALLNSQLDILEEKSKVSEPVMIKQNIIDKLFKLAMSENLNETA